MATFAAEQERRVRTLTKEMGVEKIGNFGLYWFRDAPWIMDDFGNLVVFSSEMAGQAKCSAECAR